MATPTLSPSPTRKKPVLAGVVDVQRLSRPQLSWFILTAAAFIVALVLLIWLLLWIFRPRGSMGGWWVAQRGLAGPVIGHQADDLQALVKGAQRETGYQALEPALRNRLAGAGARPVVVYLSAAGVSDGQGAYLLRPESGSLHAFLPAGARPALLGVEKLVDLCGEYPSAKKLIILDAGQVGSDRNLGVFGNGFVGALQDYLETKKPRGLAILCACGPGQASWTSETDRRSVFGHYVALGLSGQAAGWDPSSSGLTLRALHRYVRHHVARWVEANRQAVQTPVLLGDPALNFTLRQTPLTKPPAPSLDAKEVEALFTKLGEGWSRRDALAQRQPYRHTPVLWQQYQETLLRAERLLRVGEYDEAGGLLATLPPLEKKLADAANGLAWENAWSLALLDKSLAGSPPDARKEVTTAGDNLNAAFEELTRGTEEAEESPPIEPKDMVPTEEVLPPPGEPEKAGAPPLKGEKEKAGAPALKAAKPRPKPTPSAPPGKAQPKGASALAAIKARDDNLPLFVEGQVLVWAGTFAKRKGVPYSFKGARGDLLFDALQTRRLAEEAAGSDERLRRWIAPVVEEGDAFRRRAQDGLFARDTGQFDALSGLLDEARTRYREALSVADRCGKALDLVERLDAELPYYGEWKARRGGRDAGLDEEFVKLVGATAALARLVLAEPPAAQDEGEALRPLRDQVRKIDAQYRDVSAAFRQLQSDFQTQCAGLSSSGSGRWREIDALLDVPLIPAETRRALLQRVRTVATSGTLAGAEAAGPPEDADEPPEKVVGTLRAGRAAQREEREEREEASSSPAVTTAPDLDFWRQALGLARLEWGLLELGGVPEAELSGLEGAYESARVAAKGSPEVSRAAFDRLSHLIRELRAGRLKACQQPPAPAFAPRAAADQAARVLPLADTLGLTDRAAEALDQFHRQSLLVWHARRLLLDFAPSHAQRLLALARQLLETDDLAAATAEAADVARARLALRAEPEQTITIKGWSEEPLAVAATAVGKVPAGDATLLVGYDPSQPLTVTEKTAHHDAREGALIPVRPERAAGRVEYTVARTESSHSAILADLSPSAFYRGRFFQNDRGLQANLQPAKDPVALTIQQSYKGIRRNFTDQFKEHPGQGYLHYGTNLQYKLVLTADHPMKVAVRYGLKEHPESFKTVSLDIAPKKPGEIEDVVQGDDFPIVKTPDDLLNVAPLNLSVTVWKDKANGLLQGRANYTFRMIPPSQYIAVAAGFDPGTRTVYLVITHLANDPVTGPIDVYAAVGGYQLASPWPILRSRFAVAWFPIPIGVKKVRWRAGVEQQLSAFTGELETPLPEGMEEPAPAKKE